jgi:hypothetical protein
VFAVRVHLGPGSERARHSTCSMASGAPALESVEFVYDRPERVEPASKNLNTGSH